MEALRYTKFMEKIITISAIRLDIVREQLFSPQADGIELNLRRIAPPGAIVNSTLTLHKFLSSCLVVMPEIVAFSGLMLDA
ncbi:hypothetical protein D1BOALGB6SA_5407 [Olavius sp. associated proteobacterium Delta 1]|nr:hypothetical protein D1BOALGB6SA_5407 [Olavius sp. associated proteobacterium Delta 1]